MTATEPRSGGAAGATMEALEPALLEGQADTRKVRWTVILCSVAVFLIALEITIISVALPKIEDAFPDSTRATLSWVFTAYNVGVASLMLLAGWTAERLGRKRVFLWGMAIFLGGSVLTGLAPTVGLLIGGRVVQSIGGAMLLPSSLALILNAVEDDRRDMAIGVWGAMAGLAAAVGPTLGAVLVEFAGWRWVFLVNVPIAAVALVKGSSILEDTRNPNAPDHVDVVAVPLGAMGVGSAVFAITAAGPLGADDPRVVASACGAVALLMIFFWRSATHDAPLFPPDLARRPSYAVGAAGTLLFGAAFSGWLVLAPTFLVEVWDYSVLRAGFAIAPAPIAMAITAGPAGTLAARHGHRSVIALGSLLPVVAVGLWVSMIDAEAAYVTAFLPGAVLLGVGVGVGFPMLTAASLRDVEPGRYAIGAAGNTTLRQVAIALGISIAIAIVGTTDTATEDIAAFRGSWVVCGVLFAATAAVIAVFYPDPNPMATPNPTSPSGE